MFRIGFRILGDARTYDEFYICVRDIKRTLLKSFYKFKLVLVFFQATGARLKGMYRDKLGQSTRRLP